MAETAAPPKRRRLRRFLAIVVFGPLIALASLPTLVSLGPARMALVALANQHLAPARVEVADLRLSWFGTLELSGLSLFDPQSKRLIGIGRATLDRSLVELLLDRSSPGTLTLIKPALDITRRADGSIDLVDLLPKRPAAPAVRPDSSSPPPADPGGALFDVDCTLKVVQGSLRLTTPELIDPFVVDRFDLTAQTTVAPGPLNFRLRMEKGSSAGSGSAVSSLAIDGLYDLRARPAAAADLTLNLLARRWPFSARGGGVAARGTLDGQFAVIQKAGRWDVKGDTRLFGLDISGAALAGDRLQLDVVTAIWDVVQGQASSPPSSALRAPSPRGGEGAAPGSGAATWDIRRLKLTSPVGTLAASGPIQGLPGTAAVLEGRVDLAALARQLPHALRLREGLAIERGEAGLRLGVRYEADGQTAELTAQLSDLLAHDSTRTIALRSPARLAGRLTRRGSNLELEQLELTSDFLKTTGSGDLTAGIKVTGALDLGALQAQLRDLIDFGSVAMGGQSEYALTYRRAGAGPGAGAGAGASFAAALTAEFHGLDLRGLTAAPIHREAIRLEAAASGGTDASGMPLSLGELKVGLAAGQIGAFATAATKDGQAALSLVASGPLTLSEQTDGVVRGDLKFQGAWRAPALDINTLRLTVHPASVPPEASPPALAVRGRFDRSLGELVLSPLAGTPPGAIGVAAEGLRISGLGGGAGVKVDGILAGDLAVLDQLLAGLSGAARYDIAGLWTGKVTAQPTADGRLQLGVGLSAPDLTRGGAPGQPRSQEGPIALAARATYKSDGGLLDIEELRLVTRYAALDGRGPLADVTGRRVVDLQGTLTPNWLTLNALVASAVEPGARLQGGAPRAFRVKGPLSGASLAELLRGLNLELGIDLVSAKAYGLNLGPAPLVLLCDGGRTIIAPIRTTLNNGSVDLRPELGLDDPRGLTLRLLPGSSLQNVAINDEVSHKVLSYIAPVLDEATQVHGRISASFARAEFPIGGSTDRTMTVAGSIVFNDVSFGAGPLGNELLTLAGKGPDTALRMNQPVQLAIADRRIHQSGLEIPINRETKITIKGSVGFDQTLALRAEVPLNPSMLGRDKALQSLASGTTIPVPVGGTLSHPRIDRQALAAAMREVTRTILKRGAKEEASELLKRFVR
jgi:translocation and assembly module TamB